MQDGSDIVRKMRTDTRKSMNSVQNACYPMTSALDPIDPNKKTHIPFHQKRATMGHIGGESMSKTIEHNPF